MSHKINYVVDFYQKANNKSPVQDYIDDLLSKNDKDSKIKYKKILAYIEMLEEFGTISGKPYVDFIIDEIWELRPSGVRIFFFWDSNKMKFILLHYFIKKTQKTPINEINQARNNMRDYLNRS
jgi:phage-related protein